jgi:hypothetical protein
MEIGTVVRDRLWGGRHTGTVVNVEGPWVFVAWHGSCVEDQLDATDVEVWADAPDELRSWRGGIACLGGVTGPVRVIGVPAGR